MVVTVLQMGIHLMKVVTYLWNRLIVLVSGHQRDALTACI